MTATVAHQNREQATSEHSIRPVLSPRRLWLVPVGTQRESGGPSGKT
jgi:hypothetical protein